MTTSEKLAEAEAAYHALVTGTQPKVVVDQNGERVEYTPANATRLYLYIQQLKKELGTITSSGPLRPYF